MLINVFDSTGSATIVSNSTLTYVIFPCFYFSLFNSSFLAIFFIF